ncbi:MAG TPA: xanthine dehydrogenase family protein molybdopterin-binding subunit, partial [Beijerinckiaceae bacterium]|nr:xanthine dehydrogenase family protein molybdopterin-binding subunit [Beijerinckiaceae bacterium]
MNTPIPSDELALMKFGIGQPVPRLEDPKLLRGEGRYTDDLDLPGQVYAVIVRSPHAHGIIRAVDTAAAREMPGVLGVYTAADLERGGYGLLKVIPAFKNRDGSPMLKPARFALATDRVRFVGDPVAFVVAETAAGARDAAEAVSLDIEALPAVTRPEEALAPGAPQLYEDVPGNCPLDFHFGDAERVTQAFAAAAHVTRLKLTDNRVVVNPMEPRSAVGAYAADEGRWTLHVGSQGVFGLSQNMAEILGVPRDKMRVLTGNVGGSFGMKAAPYPEYVCLLHAARALRRPVKWTDLRSESFLSDHHGRALELDSELALDAAGRFLAVRVSGYADLGAFMTQMSPLPSTLNVAKNLVSVYRTPAIDVSIRCAFTNTTPIGPYRGAGRPEGNYIMERLIDKAAAEMGIDPVELRRRNHIRPEELPYKAPSDMTYDSGAFTEILDRAVEAADWPGYEARKAESRARGKLRGRGIGQYLEVTAPPQNEMGGIRFEADGAVTIITGTLDYGQGHATPFAQVLASRLGIPFETIRLVQGDSTELVAGGGTGGSKSIMASGTAIVEASGKVIEQGRQIAAHVLEAGVADIEFANGRFVIAGTDRSIGIMELAERLCAGLDLPPDAPQSLDVKHVHRLSPAAFPNGCH